MPGPAWPCPQHLLSALSPLPVPRQGQGSVPEPRGPLVRRDSPGTAAPTHSHGGHLVLSLLQEGHGRAQGTGLLQTMLQSGHCTPCPVSVPAHHHLHRKALPRVQVELCVHQSLPVFPCAVAGRHREEPAPAWAPPWTPMGTGEVPWVTSCRDRAGPALSAFSPRSDAPAAPAVPVAPGVAGVPGVSGSSPGAAPPVSQATGIAPQAPPPRHLPIGHAPRRGPGGGQWERGGAGRARGGARGA